MTTSKYEYDILYRIWLTVKVFDDNRKLVSQTSNVVDKSTDKYILRQKLKFYEQNHSKECYRQHFRLYFHMDSMRINESMTDQPTDQPTN